MQLLRCNDAPNELINVYLKNNLIPALIQSHIGGVRAALESGVPTIRNRLSAHGQGVQIVQVPLHYPRRVMEAALRRGASALIFAHHHPNGNVRPSKQDKTLTRALVFAAAALQIKVIDHLVVSTTTVFSFRKEGLL